MSVRDVQSILVLAGGPGNERAVSLNSGQAICLALEQAGFDVRLADAAPDDLSALDQYDYDLIFPIIHGTFGEDGQLQAILEERGLPYIGSDARASRLAMNKQATRELMASCQVPVANGLLIPAAIPPDALADQLDLFLAQVGLPLVIKPNCEGSSVGVTIAATADQALETARNVIKNYGDCLLEQFVFGRELTVGVLVDQPLPLIEIRTASGFYDFEAKYIKEDTEYIVNPDLPVNVVKTIQDSALKIFQALPCYDLGRIDFILGPDDSFIALEVNTLPGFTEHSLLPKAAGALGLDMPEICTKIVQNAWQRSIV